MTMSQLLRVRTIVQAATSASEGETQAQDSD